MASPFILTIVIIDCVAALVAITKLIISFTKDENKLIEAVQEESQQKSASLHKKIANSSSSKILIHGQVIEDFIKNTLENIMQIVPVHKKICELERVPISDLKLMCKNKVFNDILKTMDEVFVTNEIIDDIVKINPIAFDSVNLVSQL